MRNKNAKVSNPNDFVTCPGDEIQILYSPVIAPDGSMDLVPSGKENVQDYINSFRDSCDMDWILSRLQLGDTSVLGMKFPLYGDFSAMPKTYAEVLQLVIDGQKDFEALPVDVRKEFDNDFSKWFATAGSGEWMSKMSSVLPDQADQAVAAAPVSVSEKEGDFE